MASILCDLKHELWSRREKILDAQLFFSHSH
jgi:hypothetical protein